MRRRSPLAPPFLSRGGLCRVTKGGGPHRLPPCGTGAPRRWRASVRRRDACATPRRPTWLPPDRSSLAPDPYAMVSDVDVQPTPCAIGHRPGRPAGSPYGRLRSIAGSGRPRLCLAASGMAHGGPEGVSRGPCRGGPRSGAAAAWRRRAFASRAAARWEPRGAGPSRGVRGGAPWRSIRRAVAGAAELVPAAWGGVPCGGGASSLERWRLWGWV